MPKTTHKSAERETKDFPGSGEPEGRFERNSEVTPMGVGRKKEVLHKPKTGFKKSYKNQNTWRPGATKLFSFYTTTMIDLSWVIHSGSRPMRDALRLHNTPSFSQFQSAGLPMPRNPLPKF
jgi:hypothetical protein